MGEPSEHSLAWFLVAAFSRYGEALDWTRERLAASGQTPELESPRFAFAETEYYTPTMGPGLQKQFFLVPRPFDAGELATWKRTTNAWEVEYARQGRHAEPRPLNLDPGYLTIAKLVLASTKDHSHRIYLGQGIFAEVTLHYHSGAWQPRDWTFADYRREDYRAFFATCRDALRRSRRGEHAP